MHNTIKEITETKLETSRLVINDITNNDASFIQQLTNSEGWLQFIGDRNVNSKEQAITYIQKITDNPNVKYWKVSLKTSSIPIGVITLIKRDYLDDLDIGFAFLPEYSGKGYAFEATKAVIDAVINDTEIKCIYGITSPHNDKSIGLLKKLGLLYKKTITEDGENVVVYAVSIDQYKINEITRSFFSIFNNKQEKSPDWNKIYKTCIPEVIIIKKEGLKQEVYNLETFIEPRKKILEDGTLTDFEEYETESETMILGNLAQRKTVYQKKGIFNGTEFNQKGNKLFQYVKSDLGWKINAVIWEDIV